MRAPRTLVAALLSLTVAVALTACQPPPPPPAEPKACDVAVVGDSLTVGVKPYVAKALSDRGCRLAWIDGKGNRRTFEGLEIIKARAAANQLPNVLIVGLGTNDLVPPGRLRRPHRRGDATRDRPQGHLGRARLQPDHGEPHGILRAKDRQHPNLSIMEWDRQYSANPSWRSTDNIHATPGGYAALAALMGDMARAVVK